MVTVTFIDVSKLLYKKEQYKAMAWIEVSPLQEAMNNYHDVDKTAKLIARLAGFLTF